ncbi:hypothetical protein KUTeg_003021 [Tegillarca granosa]|uniref:Uncharacterized protein n=1 Tax=Tegillarca granosa TaxID=220873 RepID=A0ABQ9FKX0_TEGGR|nr:hypothetical protein KUTeg_003021 [Tegillarca granosa]
MIIPHYIIIIIEGAGTALLGKEGAMACTVAVEEVIGDHYNSQIRELMEDDPEKHKELLKIIKKFRDDELHHHDTGLEHDAEKVCCILFYMNSLLVFVSLHIRLFCIPSSLNDISIIIFQVTYCLKFLKKLSLVFF